MRAQPGQRIHGVREPVLAQLRDRGAARWQGHRVRRLHALRRCNVIGTAILAGVLATAGWPAGAALKLACGKVETSLSTNLDLNAMVTANYPKVVPWDDLCHGIDL